MYYFDENKSQFINYIISFVTMLGKMLISASVYRFLFIVIRYVVIVVAYVFYVLFDMCKYYNFVWFDVCSAFCLFFLDVECV